MSTTTYARDTESGEVYRNASPADRFTPVAVLTREQLATRDAHHRAAGLREAERIVMGPTENLVDAATCRTLANMLHDGIADAMVPRAEEPGYPREVRDLAADLHAYDTMEVEFAYVRDEIRNAYLERAHFLAHSIWLRGRESAVRREAIADERDRLAGVLRGLGHVHVADLVADGGRL
jgi:hypothetical protein